MQCINPIKAGFTESGDLTFSPRKMSKELEPFEFECRKCLPCRLNIAREKAIRAMHETQIHKENIFVTLTYAPEHLKSEKLCYIDFQLFMKSLRELHTRDISDPELKKQMSISYMVTGEYGDLNKRPHWHAIIFNYRPSDEKPTRKTELGHQVYESETLNRLWKKGLVEYGDVTLESANYVARYAAKKLAHGQDQEHDYHPIHKTSSKHAIGKRWIEKYWKRTFAEGNVLIRSKGDIIPAKIPRYYTDWLKKNKPDEWRRYVSQKRLELQTQAQEKNRNEELAYLSELVNQKFGDPRPITKKKINLTILNQKFKRLQEKLKL